MKAYKAIVSNTDYLTSQSFLFEREGISGDKTYFCLLISSSGEDIFNRVRQVGLFSQDIFYDSTADIPGKILESLNFVLDELKDVSSLNILAAAFSQKALYLQSIGENRAFLLREDKMMRLPLSQQLLSGFLEDGDKLLLLNSNVDSDEEGREKALIFSTDFAEELLLDSKEELEASLEDLVSEQRVSLPLSVVVLDLTEDILIDKAPEIKKVRENPFKKLPFDKVKLVIKLVPNTFKKILSLNLKYKIALALGLIIALGLSFFVFTTVSKNRISQQEINLQLNLAEEKFNQAREIKDTDRSKAKQLLDESNSAVVTILGKDKNHSKALSLKNQIESSTPEILRIYKIANFPVFLSLDLIKKDYSSKRLAFSVGELLLYDQNQKSLVALSLDNKTNRILVGEREVGNAESFSLNGDKAFTYSKDRGVIQIDINSRKSLIAAKPDAAWGHIADIYAFAGNFYLLDTVNGQIWKYFPLDSAFSERQEYLKGEADLVGALRMQIDGSIWVINADSQVLKFTNGEVDNFVIQGLDQPFGKLISFFVSSDTNYLYILDQENSRVVLLEKNGKYHSQYQGDKFKTADDLVVAEDQKKLYLLEGNKVYQLDLK